MPEGDVNHAETVGTPIVSATNDHNLLTAYLADRQVPCPGCGYDLKGVQSGACPECGVRPTLAIVRPESLLRSRMYLIALLILVSSAVNATWTGMNFFSMVQIVGWAGIVDVSVLLQMGGTVLFLVWPSLALVAERRRRRVAVEQGASPIDRSIGPLPLALSFIGWQVMMFGLALISYFI